MDCGHASGMPQQNIGLTPLRRRWICVLCMSDPEKDQPCFKWIPTFNCCQVEQSTQDLCKQFYYQSLLFFNQFALQWGSLGHKPWSVYGSLECIGTNLNCTMCFHLSTHVFPFPKWTSVNRGWKKTGDTVLTTRCAPALPTLDRVTWPIAPTDGKCWYGEVVEVHILRLSFARSRRCSHGHPKSGRLVQQHGLGVLLGRFWTEEIWRKRREGVLKGWKSVCEIRLKQELLDVATCTGTIRQESVSPWWRLELPTCDEPLGLLTWPG